MGTPDYAVPTLEALAAAGHEIAAVFSQPDKPVGRKHILTPPPVKTAAQALGIPVYQPQTWKDGEAVALLREIAPDLAVVVAYGKILPQEGLSVPKFGCVNGHASILPAYRGASPIQWCIVCGEIETGVTVMQMDEGMDTGDILATVRTPIEPDENAEELFARLSRLTADVMVQTLREIENGTVHPVPQPDDGVSYAPIIRKEMAQLRFSEQTAKEVHNAVRGYVFWPCAHFFHDGKRIKVWKTALSGETGKEPGAILSDRKRFLVVCQDGKAIELVTVQPEGGKPMPGRQLLAGPLFRDNSEKV